jgi:hypothetical protein
VRHRLARLLRLPPPRPGPDPDPAVAALRTQLDSLIPIAYRAGAQAHPFDGVAANVYSSSGEDGILDHILARVGHGTRRCVDLGAGSPEGSNVAALIVDSGYQGLLVDADSAGLEQAAAFYRNAAAAVQPIIVNARVTVDNVNELLADFAGEVDVLSIDLDGIDYWIWEAIEAIQPRVLVVEYQDILGPDRSWTVPYRADFSAGDHQANTILNNYCGASLRALTTLSERKGLRLVGCNPGGWNAFFVRRGLAEAELKEATVASCFRFAWNEYGMKVRFPLVASMDWVEV